MSAYPDSFTRYYITHRDGTPVDPARVFYVLDLTGAGEHAAACRKALSVYADTIAVPLPQLAAECRTIIAQETARAGGKDAEPAYVASADGQTFRSEVTYKDRNDALLRAPADLDIPAGGQYWIGYLAPLRITGDVWMWMHDLVNSLDEQGHAVASLQKLLSVGDETTDAETKDMLRAEADARLEMLADMIAPVVRAWALRCGVDLSNLWGVTGVEQCTRPLPA